MSTGAINVWLCYQMYDEQKLTRIITKVIVKAFNLSLITQPFIVVGALVSNIFIDLQICNLTLGFLYRMMSHQINGGCLL